MKTTNHAARLLLFVRLGLVQKLPPTLKTVGYGT